MTGSTPSGEGRVLIVEDESLIAMDLAEMVMELGMEVLGPAATVEKALALLELHRPCGALLDENLRGTPVTPVAEHLARNGVPFVIVSGHVRSPFAEPLLQEARRIQKPATAAQIRAVTREFQKRW